MATIRMIEPEDLEVQIRTYGEGARSREDVVTLRQALAVHVRSSKIRDFLEKSGAGDVGQFGFCRMDVRHG